MGKSLQRVIFIMVVLPIISVSAQVGINTKDPTQVLDINGNIRIRDVPIHGDNLEPTDNLFILDKEGNGKVISPEQILKSDKVPIERLVFFGVYKGGSFISNIGNRTFIAPEPVSQDKEIVSKVNPYVLSTWDYESYQVKKTGLYSVIINSEIKYVNYYDTDGYNKSGEGVCVLTIRGANMIFSNSNFSKNVNGVFHTYTGFNISRKLFLNENDYIKISCISGNDGIFSTNYRYMLNQAEVSISFTELKENK